MRIIGCDLHARQQTLAMLETTTGEVVTLTLMHEGNNVWEFYSKLPRPVLVGIEATGSMPWFLNLMEELGIDEVSPNVSSGCHQNANTQSSCVGWRRTKYCYICNVLSNDLA